MMDHTLEALLHRIADASAAVILPYFRAGLTTDDKGHDGWFDPVTQADRDAETAIRAVLEEQCPDDSIFGEEFDAKHGISDRRWIIDPIDGTRSFLAGIPLFGTIVGLAEGERSIAGLFNQPFTGERFFGNGDQAWLVRGDKRDALHTRTTTSLSDARLMTTSPDLFSEEERPRYDAIEQSVQLARYGADGYAYAMLAAGQIDLVIESGLNSHDVAGLVPIVRGAGGIMTTWDGGDPINGGQIVAAATAELHETTLARLR